MSSWETTKITLMYSCSGACNRLRFLLHIRDPSAFRWPSRVCVCKARFIPSCLTASDTFFFGRGFDVLSDSHELFFLFYPLVAQQGDCVPLWSADYINNPPSFPPPTQALPSSPLATSLNSISMFHLVNTYSSIYRAFGNDFASSTRKHFETNVSSCCFLAKRGKISFPRGGGASVGWSLVVNTRRFCLFYSFVILCFSPCNGSSALV